MRATRPAKSRWARYMVALTVCVLAAGGSAAHAQSAKGKGPETSAQAHAAHADRLVSARLAQGRDEEVARVIVTVAPGAKQRGLLRVLEARGATVSADFTITNTFAAEVPVKLLRWLQQHADVVAISSDVEVHSMGISSDVSGTALESDYSLRSTLGLESTSLTGAGVTVAVVDSGLVLPGTNDQRVLTTRDFTTGLSNPKNVTAADPYGHGTHVAGLIGDDSDEFKGIAPGVRYVSLRVLDRNGSGTASSVIKALQWAIANRNAYGINVINLSLGHPIYEPAATDPLVQAVEAVVRAGIVVVASAGNFGTNAETDEVGYAGISSPGNAPSAITVGALKTFDTTRRTDDLIADYSSRGPTLIDGAAKPDLVAPGHRLVAAAMTSQTLYTAHPELRVTLAKRRYLKLSGTSMSAAVVTGSVALMLEEAKSDTVPCRRRTRSRRCCRRRRFRCRTRRKSRITCWRRAPAQ